jgi:glutathione S-transferase
VLRWLSWNDWHWAQIVAPFYSQHVVKRTFNFGEPDRASLEAKVPDFRRYAEVLERHLKDKTFIACNRLTVGDFQLASMAAYSCVAEMPLNDYPHIVRCLDRLMQIPAWEDPWPGEADMATLSPAARQGAAAARRASA